MSEKSCVIVNVKEVWKTMIFGDISSSSSGNVCIVIIIIVKVEVTVNFQWKLYDYGLRV